MGGEPLLTSLSMENGHPSTLLSMDPAGSSSQHQGASADSSGNTTSNGDRELFIIPRHEPAARQGPPDINLPLSAYPSPAPASWSLDPFDILDVGLGTQTYESEVPLTLPKPSGNGNGNGMGARKCAKRGDSIWGAWFFFNHYFRPALVEKPKGKVTRDASGTVSGFDKSDLRLDVFIVQPGEVHEWKRKL